MKKDKALPKQAEEVLTEESVKAIETAIEENFLLLISINSLAFCFSVS